MNNKNLYIRSSSAEFLIFEQQKEEKGKEGNRSITRNISYNKNEKRSVQY